MNYISLSNTNSILTLLAQNADGYGKVFYLLLLEFDKWGKHEARFSVQFFFISRTKLVIKCLCGRTHQRVTFSPSFLQAGFTSYSMCNGDAEKLGEVVRF